MTRTRSLLIALAVAACASPVFAQVAQPTAGYDYVNSRFRPLNVDPNGKLQVVGSASGGIAFGPDAQGVAPTQAPITDGCVFNNPTVAAGQVVRQQCDANGHLIVNINGTVPTTLSGSPTVVDTQPTAANLNAQVQGPGASGAALSGNPVRAGCGFTTVPPTVTTGQTSDAQCDANGALHAGLWNGVNQVGSVGGTSNAITATATSMWLQVQSWSRFSNATANQNERASGITDTTDVPTGVGVQAVAPAPTSNANQGITPVVSAALESGHVLKASAGNGYRYTVTTTQAGWFLIFNATTVPVDGAVTPVICRAVPIGSTEIDHSTFPDVFSTGISAAMSSTGCFTKTAIVTAMIEGSVK